MNSINKLQKLILVVAGSMEERDAPFKIQPSNTVYRVKQSIPSLSTHLFYPPFPAERERQSFRGRCLGDDLQRGCNPTKHYADDHLWATEPRVAAPDFMPTLGRLIHEEVECIVIVTYALLAVAIVDGFVSKYLDLFVEYPDDYISTMADTEFDGVIDRPFFLELDCVGKRLEIVR